MFPLVYSASYPVNFIIPIQLMTSANPYEALDAREQ